MKQLMISGFSYTLFGVIHAIKYVFNVICLDNINAEYVGDEFGVTFLSIYKNRQAPYNVNLASVCDAINVYPLRSIHQQHQLNHNPTYLYFPISSNHTAHRLLDAIQVVKVCAISGCVYLFVLSHMAWHMPDPGRDIPTQRLPWMALNQSSGCIALGPENPADWKEGGTKSVL